MHVPNAIHVFFCDNACTLCLWQTETENARLREFIDQRAQPDEPETARWRSVQLELDTKKKRQELVPNPSLL
eukprot:COSAG05_NODE_1479_length_4770_cov_4.525583_7_plen_72_part_00